MNSQSNLSATLTNNTIKYSPNSGTTWYTVIFPDGSYTVADINTVLQNAFLSLNEYAIVNGTVTYPINFLASIYLDRVQIQLNPGYQIDLTIGLFYQLIGFNYGIYSNPSGASFPLTVTAPSIALFANASVQFAVYTDIINGGVNTNNNNLINGILKVVDGGALGFSVSLKEPNGQYDYYPCSVTGQLRQITLSIYNNYGQISDFRGEPSSFELTFRPIRD